MSRRIALLVAALVTAAAGAAGVRFSGATWSDSSNTVFDVRAAPDWTPPEVAVDDLGTIVSGPVTVTAHAHDEQSDIDASTMVLDWASSTGGSWTPMSGCTPSGSGHARDLTCTLDTDTAASPDGDYFFRVTATNTEGYTGSAQRQTAIVNGEGGVIAPVPSAVRGTITLSSEVANGNNGKGTWEFDYRSGGSGWHQICESTSQTDVRSCEWNTTTVPDGVYDVRLWADPFEDIQAGITVDNTAPSATLLPPAGGVLSGTSTLQATASDALTGIASVRFDYRRVGDVDWSTCRTDASSPYTCDLDTTTLAPGTYELRASATDGVGNEGASPVVSAVVDNSPATVAITAPGEGSSIDGTVTVAANASSPRGVTSVRIDARPQGGSWGQVCDDTTEPYTCDWATADLPGGGYELRAVLAQGGGAADVTSDTRRVTVDHSAGVVSISSPLDGATLDHPTTVGVTGTASSPYGVRSVTLKAIPVTPSGAIASMPCSVTSGSFACTWDVAGIVYGTYELRVAMTQGNGTVVASLEPVYVTVDNVTASILLKTPVPNNGYVGGTVPLSATVSSNLQPVSSVRYEYLKPDAAAFETFCTPTTNASPYSCSWATGADGAYQVQAVMTLPNGRVVRSSPTTLNVVNLRGADVQAGNGNGTMAAGDTLKLTFSSKVKYSSILSGWTGTAATGGVRLSFVNATSSKGTADYVKIPGLGQVTFEQDYVKNQDFTMPATLSAVEVAGASVVTVTLGEVPNGRTNTGAAGKMRWLPTANNDSPRDAYHDGLCAPAEVLESGVAADADF